MLLVCCFIVLSFVGSIYSYHINGLNIKQLSLSLNAKNVKKEFLNLIESMEGNVNNAGYSPLDEVEKVQRKGGNSVIPVEKIIKNMQFHQIDKDSSDEVIGLAIDCIKKWKRLHSNFKPVNECDKIILSFQEIVDIKVSSNGGYPLALRKLLLFERNIDGDIENITGNDEVDVGNILSILQIKGNFMFTKPSVDDIKLFLNSHKINDSTIGDIIITPSSVQVVMFTEMVDQMINSNVTSMNETPIIINKCDLTEINARKSTTKALSIVEASTRVDAIVSTCFNLSRNKVQNLIESGDCSIDYKMCKGASCQVSQGQVVNLYGYGKLVVEEVSETNKGRFKIKINKFI
jgi:RNA-binding protein YlmH